LNEELYISIIGEVFDGYTEVAFKGDPVYIKHYSIRDQRYIQKYYEKHKNIAIRKGLETEEERSKATKLDGIWSDEDDLEILKLESEVKNLITTSKKLFIPSQKKAMEKDADEKKSAIYSLKIKRKEIIGKTAEDYASVRSNEEMLRYFLFKDKELTKSLFEEDEFSELDDLELMFFMRCQEETSARLSELNIQKAVLRPFFSMYLSQCDNINDFYGKPIVLLSAHQLKVALYARMFYSIFQHVEDIPDNIKDDPEKLLAFSEMQSNRNKNSSMDMIDDNADATSIFGATEEDVRALSKGNAKTISLSDELAKNGGSLNMEQMMKLSGY
jgi:hypothetical protein